MLGLGRTSDPRRAQVSNELARMYGAATKQLGVICTNVMVHGIAVFKHSSIVGAGHSAFGEKWGLRESGHEQSSGRAIGQA